MTRGVHDSILLIDDHGQCTFPSVYSAGGWTLPTSVCVCGGEMVEMVEGRW